VMTMRVDFMLGTKIASQRAAESNTTLAA
jgi:hypothetical protein